MPSQDLSAPTPDEQPAAGGIVRELPIGETGTGRVIPPRRTIKPPLVPHLREQYQRALARQLQRTAATIADAQPENLAVLVAALTDTVMSVRDAHVQALTAERDMLGRENDRLRKDWTSMRGRAERADAKVVSTSEDALRMMAEQDTVADRQTDRFFAIYDHALALRGRARRKLLSLLMSGPSPSATPAGADPLRHRLDELVTRWCTEGPPRLGISLSRYWDGRIAELVAILAATERRPHTADQRAIDAEGRLHACREVLIKDGHFTADEIGPDVAPHLVEWLAHHRDRTDEAECRLTAVLDWRDQPHTSLSADALETLSSALNTRCTVDA